MIFIPIIIVTGILLSEILKRNQNNKTPLWLKINEFFGIDLRALALFRISLGLTVIYDLLNRMSDLTEHYTDIGVMPRSVLENIFPYNAFPYIYMITGSSVGISILFFINILLAILFTFGLYTRFVSPLLWYFIISLHYRNMLVCFGGDLFLHSLLFWGMFLPLEQKWSLDSLLMKAEFKQKQKNVLSFGTAAYILQIVILYVISTEHKYSPEWRVDGTAIYYALSYDLYLRPLGKFVYDLHPDNFFAFLTFSTYWLERAGPFLLFLPIYTNFFRIVIILLIIAMHIGINLFMNVGYFGIVSILAMFPLVPSLYIDQICERFKPQFETIRAKYFKKYLDLIELKFGGKEKARDNVPLEFKNILIILVLSYTLVQNISTINPIKYVLPKEIANAGKIFYLEQQWSMFVPSTLKLNWWLTMPGELKDGSKVDVFRGGKEINWEKPFLILDTIKSFRTSTYLNNLLAYKSTWTTHLLNYSNFICTNWNSTHTKEKQLKEFDIFYIFEENLSNYRNGFPQKKLVWKQFCNMDKAEKDKLWDAINSNVELKAENCDLQNSIKELNENLNYLNKKVGPDSPANIQCLLKLAECYRAVKNYSESEKVYRKMIYICEKAFGEDQMFTYSLYYYLIDVLRLQGKTNEQNEAFNIAISNLKRISSQNVAAIVNDLYKYREEMISESCKKKYK